MKRDFDEMNAVGDIDQSKDDKIQQLERRNKDLEQICSEFQQKHSEIYKKLNAVKRFFGGAYSGLLWEELPSEWKKDNDVVDSALATKHYRNLPESWKCEPKVISQAMKQYRGQQYLRSNLPWNSIPEPARQKKEVVLEALKYYPYCLDKWEEIPEALRHDHDIAAKSVQLDMVKVDDVPTLQDHNILRKLIEEEKLNWGKLPKRLAHNIDFVTSLARVSIDTAYDLIQSVPGLSFERNFWIMLSKTSEKYTDKYRRHRGLCEVVAKAPDFILADESILLGLLKRDQHLDYAYSAYSECLFSLVPLSLWKSYSFVQGALGSKLKRALWYLPKEEQLQYMDLIAEYFLAMDTDFYRDLVRAAKSISPELWKEQTIMHSWINAGHPFVRDVHPDTLTRDRDLVLLMAQKVQWSNWFADVSVELRNDKEFVKKVMKICPNAFLNLSKEFQKDFDLALLFIVNEHTIEKKEFLRNSDDSWKSLLLKPLIERITIMQKECEGWDIAKTALFGDSGTLYVGPEATLALQYQVFNYLGYPSHWWLKKTILALEECSTKEK